MKKRVITLLVPVLFLVMALGFQVKNLAASEVNATSEDAATTAETVEKSIVLDKESLILKVKKTSTLTATVTGTEGTVKWSSSKKSVASVNQNGKITAKKAGTATITAKVDSVKATCTVKVIPTIKLNKTKATVKTKKTVQLKATVKGSTKTVKWTSSNKSIATVNSKGKVNGKKAGTVTITAKVAGATAKCKVTVKAPAVGRTGTYEKDFGGSIREVTIKQISSTKIKFQVRFTSLMKISTSNAITAKVNGNKVSFKYEDLGWGGSGTGTMTLNKNWVKIKLTNTSGTEEYLHTGGNTYKLKRVSNSKKFIFY